MTCVNLDLNLLVAFDALLDEGSVSGAADRLRVTQPAMSRTLARLRRATGDQILVRSGRAMLPTPYAESVRERVRALVEQAGALLRPATALDEAELASLTRTFTLRCNDALVDAAGAEILAAVRVRAPGMRLRFLAESAVDTDDLRRGEVDLEIAAGASGRPELCARRVGGGTQVVVVRAGHPLTGLTRAAYAAAEHVTVSRRGRLRGPLDEALAAEGLTRRVVATVPTVSAAFRLVAASDLLAAVPSMLAGPGLAPFGLRALPLPLALPPVPLTMTWHRRQDDDPAHRWLRERVCEALRAAGVPG